MRRPWARRRGSCGSCRTARGCTRRAVATVGIRSCGAADQVRARRVRRCRRRCCRTRSTAISAWSMLPCCSLRVRAVVTAFSRPSNRSGAALAYTSPRSASSWLSWRICGICGLRSARISLPLTIDWPNRSPSPLQRLRGRGQRLVQLDRVDLLRDIRRTVSNNVLNSVVTDVTSITSEVVMRCGVGSFGDVKEMYLLPNTVVALISASTFCGMQLEVLGIHIQGDLRPRLIADGDRLDLADPADLHAVVGDLRAGVHRQTRARPRSWSAVRGSGSRRGTGSTPAPITAMVSSVSTRPANLYGGVRGLCSAGRSCATPSG